MTHIIPTVFALPHMCTAMKIVFTFPISSSILGTSAFKKKKNGWQMPRCSVVIVVAYSVSLRLFVSGCTNHSRPVRLIRHSSEEAASHRILISRCLTEAELRNGPRRERDSVLISPGLPIPLGPTSHSSRYAYILSMLLAQYGA